VFVFYRVAQSRRLFLLRGRRRSVGLRLRRESGKHAVTAPGSKQRLALQLTELARLAQKVSKKPLWEHAFKKFAKATTLDSFREIAAVKFRIRLLENDSKLFSPLVEFGYGY
jgi:hypothetical protein